MMTPTGAIRAAFSLSEGQRGAYAASAASFAGTSVSVAPNLSNCFANAEVYQYTVTVTRATSSSGPFTALPTPLTATLWQKSTPVQDKATFTGLLPGYVYKFAVQAQGNNDGSAPDRLLNQYNPCEPTVDLTGSTVITKTQLTPTVYLDDCAG